MRDRGKKERRDKKKRNGKAVCLGECFSAQTLKSVWGKVVNRIL